MQIITPAKLEEEEKLTKSFLVGLPKAELHVHLEGTLEPETILEFATRNQLNDFPYHTADEITQRMGDAHDLPSFIQVYEQLLKVLCVQDDFCDSVMKYLRQVHAHGVVYVEMFFDPQMHTSRGISYSTIMEGLRKAQRKAREELGIQCSFIQCFHRDRPIDSALEHLEFALDYRDVIIGVGTDNPEHINFPNDFQGVYKQAATHGFRLTAHCDVDFKTSVDNIRGCIDLLHVERIDHGVNVLEDPTLVARARDARIGFTVCPTFMYTHLPGDVNSGYHERCAEAVQEMLHARLLVTLASDDPGIMCSKYVGDLYVEVWQLLHLPLDEMVTLARNGFEMAWLAEEAKKVYLERLNNYVKDNKP